ncbi:MAG: hypothetical protein F4Z31_01615 [Gemmatimonadetes bacterium]|nr:hypothetical protein [Gemmatimonadota bacterium]
MSRSALEALDRDGLAVMAEQSGLDGDTLAELVSSLSPDERHIEAFALTAELAGAAGAEDDESSVHGSRQQRLDGVAAELVRLAEAEAGRAAARDSNAGFSERTPLEVFSELHLMLIDTADQPDTAVLCGPAGPPLPVSRSDLGSVCEPVTAKTFQAHAVALDVQLPQPGGELDARFHAELSQLEAKLAEDGPGAQWRSYHNDVFRAASAIQAGEPGPAGPWREMWAAMMATEMEYAAVVAWRRVWDVTPQDFIADPDLGAILDPMTRCARLWWLRARWRRMITDPAIPQSLCADIISAAEFEEQHVHLWQPAPIAAAWMDGQLAAR